MFTALGFVFSTDADALAFVLRFDKVDIPAPGNRKSGVLETAVPEIWKP